MLPEVLERARNALEELTPLRTDCGLVCGGACCASHPGERTGMLLFPGEEAYYAALPGYSVEESAAGRLLICPGRCERADRPLACRIFPLLPVLRAEGVKVAVDLRARAVCPLARQGRSAMQTAFVEAVREAGELLAGDAEQRRFLEALTRQQDELRALRRQFGGEGRV